MKMPPDNFSIFLFIASLEAGAKTNEEKNTEIPFSKLQFFSIIRQT
jgi:hypothetical protein